jgi:transcriptional regulator with XRE-family HTH domain
LRVVRARLASELRIARVTAGLTQASAARRAGFSQAYMSALERGVRAPSLEAACRAAAACGQELSIRLFPVGAVPLRDSGQLEIAESIMEVSRSWQVRLEVPVGDGSRRAHDLVMSLPEEVVAIEIERRIVDLQAQLRAAQLKRDILGEREDRPVRLVMCVLDTPAMRQMVREHATLVSGILPVRSRAIWLSIRTGRPTGGDGILFARPRGAMPPRPR